MVLTDLSPGLEKKVVYILDCNVCEENVSRRGMLVVLVADGKTMLFSTDKYDKSAIGVTPGVYTAKNCKCKIQSLACLSCGNVVGYHVILPCIKCLSSLNNGHHCMFHSNLVSYCYRLNEEGGDLLSWKQLKSPNEDDCMSTECIR